MSEESKSQLTRLERLAALLRDDDVDIDNMNDEQIAGYLKDNKVDTAGLQRRFDGILKKAKARLRLEYAHKQRLEAVAKSQQVRKRLKLFDGK
jgi:hypothetical protein